MIRQSAIIYLVIWRFFVWLFGGRNRIKDAFPKILSWQNGPKSPKIETEKELTAENQAVSSFQGAPGGDVVIGGYRVFFITTE